VVGYNSEDRAASIFKVEVHCEQKVDVEIGRISNLHTTHCNNPKTTDFIEYLMLEHGDMNLSSVSSLFCFLKLLVDMQGSVFIQEYSDAWGLHERIFLCWSNIVPCNLTCQVVY